MLPLDALALDRTRFVVWGICWLLATAGWVAGSLWVVQDARVVFGRTMPWKLLVTLAGTALFVGTVTVGLAALPSLLILLPLIIATSYFLARDKASPRSLQWLPWHRLRPLEERLIARLGLADWVARRRLLAEDSGRRSAALKTLLLLRHDGTPCDERDAALDKQMAHDVGLLKRLLWQAIDCGATVITLEPPATADGNAKLRCQIAGATADLPLPKRLTAAGAAAVLKNLAGLNASPARQPERGAFSLVAGGHAVEVRMAVGPGASGEKIVLRPFDPAALPSFGQLGMSEPVARKVREIILGRQGCLIVAGPPGSGKTTTVFSLLKSVDPLTTTIVTIEDRVQYRLDNVLQTTVENTPDGTVAKRLETLLRQEPAKILFGEIRDRETADIVLKTPLTGRFVISTLRAADAAGGIAGLFQVGCEPAVVQGSLTAVLAQRLIRRLCPLCKKPYEPDDEQLRQLGVPRERVSVLYEPQGCDHCLAGFRGCTGVFELVVVDERLLAALGTRLPADAIRKLAVAAGSRTLWHAALVRALAGETSVAEARRVVS